MSYILKNIKFCYHFEDKYENNTKSGHVKHKPIPRHHSQITFSNENSFLNAKNKDTNINMQFTYSGPYPN